MQTGRQTDSNVIPSLGIRVARVARNRHNTYTESYELDTSLSVSDRSSARPDMDSDGVTENDYNRK